jgi:hypothetical protein
MVHDSILTSNGRKENFNAEIAENAEESEAPGKKNKNETTN